MGHGRRSECECGYMDVNVDMALVVNLILIAILQFQEDTTMVSSVLSPMHRRLDTVSYGSYQDAAIPFPRHSGGKFCACGTSGLC